MEEKRWVEISNRWQKRYKSKKQMEYVTVFDTFIEKKQMFWSIPEFIKTNFFPDF